MKQVLENLKTGELTVEEIPAPRARPGAVCVRNHYSLISAGTEGGTVKLGKMTLLGKARARPEQARKVLQLASTEGPLTAYRTAMRALEMPMVLGYCCAGEVVEVGAGVNDLRPGDLVACGGAGYANHAEVVSVPRNLCVPVPEGVPARYAAFTTLGSVAIQSVRVARANLGESIVVIGLGLVGLLTVQILRAAGCRVFGIDIDPARVQFVIDQGYCQAAENSTSNLLEQVMAFSRGYGADGIIITATADNNQPVALAGELARHKARVVVVGRTEMKAPRETYLFKELELCTSFAYGPGTGDPVYEEDGIDYPVGYVRWTENRNMVSFLDQVQQDRIQLEPLVTHEFPIEGARAAFDLISGKTEERSTAILLRYAAAEGIKVDQGPIVLHSGKAIRPTGKKDSLRLGVIGAGSFATNEMLPLLAGMGHLKFRGIASATGVRAQALGKKYGFEFCASDALDVINDDQTDAVVILTRHDTHARLTVTALEAGKHVFVEKPMALTGDELEQVEAAHRRSGLYVMVGFNRRYAPLAVRFKEFFAKRAQPISLLYRSNVGYRPPEHWLHHPEQGGGVVLGEACHFIDFCHWMIGTEMEHITVAALGGAATGVISEDNVHITISFVDGSLATVAYLSNGCKAFSRERVEAYCDNKTAAITDYRSLELARGMRNRRSRSFLSSDKGYRNQMIHFLETIGGRTSRPFDVDSYFRSSRSTIEAAEKLATKGG